ncbi:hypothetical protein DPMN_192971 [Dreissena polymorpha]|uniref:Uncharacterized protein n=1 Tax=Dreissena polymorpha TaxID=45954 RepID=A0A9D3Y2G4_DREPO|nr:hypothetical protein DPMN_192971 [Dreissena polymorpha]
MNAWEDWIAGMNLLLLHDDTTPPQQYLLQVTRSIKNGPSVSFTTNLDIVDAFHVCTLLPEIQLWIDKCRGRYWPPAQLLETASVAPCFLVPAGHPDSDYKRKEWRLSPNLIERMLMSSFNDTNKMLYCLKSN